MKKFENPTIEMEMIVVDDIITTSPGGGNENILPEGGED